MSRSSAPVRSCSPPSRRDWASRHGRAPRRPRRRSSIRGTTREIATPIAGVGAPNQSREATIDESRVARGAPPAAMGHRRQASVRPRSPPPQL
jgi:hypothetical protein